MIISLKERRKMKEKSEFGEGLCYNLALFLAHEQGLRSFLEKHELLRKNCKVEDKELFSEKSAIQLWFYTSGDHLYDIHWEQAPKHLRKRIKMFQTKVLRWRNGMFYNDKPSKKDALWSLQEAKDLIRLIDKYHGIKTEKGRWE